MNTESFPQFRKLNNGMSYYEITNPGSLREIQIIGKYWMEHRIEASILPERVHIADLLQLTFPGVEAIDEAEFRRMEDHCRANLICRTL